MIKHIAPFERKIRQRAVHARESLAGRAGLVRCWMADRHAGKECDQTGAAAAQLLDFLSVAVGDHRRHQTSASGEVIEHRYEKR